MAQPAIKTSFASGEWAPKLQGRVDIQKYHAGASLMRNFLVDYSGGGASTRQGSKFINQVLTRGARLIPFQPSTALSFVLEFGNLYIRFISNAAYVLEPTVAIQSITGGNPVTVNSTAHGYANGDWVFISGAYYIVIAAAANTYQLTDLFGNNVTTLSGTTSARVYTLPTSYVTADLFPNAFTGNPGLKYLQDVTSLIITHPNYPPAVLTEFSASSWTLSNISFGPTIDQPAVTGVSSGGAGWTYVYVVTSVDNNGQESSTSSTVQIVNGLILNTGTPITNTLTWTPVAGAVSYNVYRSAPFNGAFSTTGPALGFIANVAPSAAVIAAGVANSVVFQESSPGIAPNFSVGPPISPTSGAGVAKIHLTNNVTITRVPLITIDAPTGGVGSIQATAKATATPNAVTPNALKVMSVDTSQGGVRVSPVGAFLTLSNGVVVQISSVGAPTLAIYPVTGLTYLGGGSSNVVGANLATSITPPASGAWTQNANSNYTVTTNSGSVTIGWHLSGIQVTNSGSGYIVIPGVTFSNPATPVAIAILTTSAGGVSIDPLSNGNPGVPGFLQERLVLAGPLLAVQSYIMSQPAFFFNFNTSFPSQDNDAIAGTIVGEDLNDIRSLIDTPGGLIALTGKGAWLINGGGGISSSNPITPSNQTASPQAFNGANDLRPIKINKDILYGTNKGNYFRDLTYNIYANIYSGDDITTLSNHLFFGHYSPDWAWSEEPFKTLWVVREDGVLLSLGYVKEQELIGWAHHDTDGQYKSVCSVIENVNGNIVDAIYVIVERLIGSSLVQYVERYADRYFPYGAEDSWSVDCALQTQPSASLLGTLTITGDASAVGNSVTLTDTIDAPFTAPMAASNWVVRAGGGIYKVTAFTSTSVVTAQVVRVPAVINQYTGVPFPVTTGFTIWQPVTTIAGLTQLVGKTVTGVADGIVVSPTVVSGTGTIVLGTPATKVTLGLVYLPQLKTLPLDLGEPTIQSKRKKLPALTLRVADTLGLQAGTSFANALSFKDFILGNLNVQSNSLVADLLNGDGRMILDQYWQEPGQLCIQQNLPYPATILAVIPEVAMGDGK